MFERSEGVWNVWNCSSMEKVATKAVSDKDATEKELKEAESRWA